MRAAFEKKSRGGWHFLLFAVIADISGCILLLLPRYYSPGWTLASLGFHNKIVLRGGVNLTPNPQPGGPGYHLLRPPAWVALPGALAPAGIAVRVI
jgi:hypothetical protein